MATLKVTITNNSTFANDKVSIGFVPGANSKFNIVNASTQAAIQPLNQNGTTATWYGLEDLGAGVVITNFSGRVYVAYGTPWTVQGPGYEPGQNVTDPNFYLRYDKMEMTFNGQPTDVANLTSIDYWSIPMSLEALKNGAVKFTVTGLNAGVTAQSLFDALNALSTPPVSGIAGPGGPDGTPIPGLVPGKYQQSGAGPAPGTTFARIIGPSSYPTIYPAPGGIPVMPYDTFSNYLTYLRKTFGPGTAAGSVVPTLGNGVIATIAGNFGGVGPDVPATGPQSAQTYNLAATIDADNNIILTGNVSGASGTTTMKFLVHDLMNPTGIYGGNAPYYLNGASQFTAPGNDVYGWITGDLFSGLNIGALGSETLSNGAGSQPIGALPSSSWFKPTMPLFGALQKEKTNYNQWGATLQPLSQAYNFAYTDRFAHVFATLAPAQTDTLNIVLENDTINMKS